MLGSAVIFVRFNAAVAATIVLSNGISGKVEGKIIGFRCDGRTEFDLSQIVQVFRRSPSTAMKELGPTSQLFSVQVAILCVLPRIGIDSGSEN
jgi:hypothetical protein